MTFLELYGEQLNIELASSDTSELFTTARRKAAINLGQDRFARATGCTRRYAELSMTDDVAEYDLEALITDYIRRDAAPSIKITQVATGLVRYIQGAKQFPRFDVDELDRVRPNWRAAASTIPQIWYIDPNSGTSTLGVNPAPAIAVSETWKLIVPYIADPADMSATTDQPFTFSSNVMQRLIPYHQALVFFAAGELEKLRKNYSGVQRQQQAYAGEVAQYLQQETKDGRDQIGLLRSYFDECGGTRVMDPYSWP